MGEKFILSEVERSPSQITFYLGFPKLFLAL